MYWTVNGNGHIPDVITVDLRTDTISQPTQDMRDAMVNAVVGDDVYGEDPTVAELERRSAEMLGKEDALFVVSGTMANLIAIMVHCTRRDSEIIAGDNSHTFRFEQGGPSQIAGVQSCLLRNKEDGTFDLNELRDKIRVDSDVHEPVTQLVIVENTHNMCGGKVLPLEWLAEVQKISRENGVKVHMDGARVMNAAVYQKVPVSEIAKYVDTICFCLSKGLGAPVGSILAGSKNFIAKANRVRKVLGGGWRQAGFLAAAGLVAIDKMISRLEEDHKHAAKIARAINATGSKICRVNAATVQTNILMVMVDRSKTSAKEIVERLATVQPDDPVRVSVKTSCRDPGFFRIVLYWEITEEYVRAAIDKITMVIKEFDDKFMKRSDRMDVIEC
ncbi:probable low-specificity L-threonine aldolase 2 [Coccinella septempunctata]|uniref:probable low-specificity L-threonine aldolase 2 n=1 Tax=Coccinella septempunctata TaxID=41139 RepID=UPI001D085106|nr:probable low-specificity L-threonine aldolase 2 [Coccinella septempunctata]